MVSASQIASRFRAELFAKLVEAVLGGLLVALLARLLEPDRYGLLFLSLSFFGIVKIFSKLGVGGSTSRYISEFKEKDPTQIPHIIRVGFIIISILSLIVSLSIVIGNEYFAEIMGEPELSIFLLLGTIFLIFSTYLHFSRKILQGFEHVEYASGVTLVESVSKFLLTLVLVIAGFGALGALAGYTLSVLIASIVGLVYIYVRPYNQSKRAPGMKPGLKRRIAEYAIPLSATDAATILDRHIDILLVGFFLNPIAVSYYVVSKQVAQFIQMPVSALGFSLAPTFAAEKASGNVDHAARLYEEALGNTLLLYIPAAAGIFLVAEPLIELVFGEEYIGAAPVLQILALYVVLFASNRIAAKALNFLGRARDRAIIKGTTSVMNVGINIILIPWMGVVGAAVATIITYSPYTFANIYLINQELEIRPWYLTKISTQITLVTIFMSGIVYLLLDYVQGWITLFLIISIGVLTWAILSMWIGLLDIGKIVSRINA